MAESVDTLRIDGRDYPLAEMPARARELAENLRFCDRQIGRLESEWAIADTARLGYTRALQREGAGRGAAKTP